jgi:hypothetical protein
MNKITSVEPDPTNNFKHVKESVLMEHMGFIPKFIMQALDRPDTSLAQGMLDAYGFGSPPMTGGVVKEDGVYSYPEDPDLHPLVKLVTERGTVYVYQYGIVSILETNKPTIVYRMD